jgi:hypothetical protein
VLSTILIKATDQHGAALVIEPGLNAVAHMGWSVNSRVFIMRSRDFLPLCVPDQIRATL